MRAALHRAVSRDSGLADAGWRKSAGRDPELRGAPDGASAVWRRRGMEGGIALAKVLEVNSVMKELNVRNNR